MASFPELRRGLRSAKAGSKAVRTVRPSILLAVVAALLLTASFAVSELATLRGAKAHDAPAFLTRALGSPLNSARLVRTPEPGVKVTLGHSTGLTVSSRKHGHVSLTTHDAGDAAWRHYKNGATRSTPFGHSQSDSVDSWCGIRCWPR